MQNRAWMPRSLPAERLGWAPKASFGRAICAWVLAGWMALAGSSRACAQDARVHLPQDARRAAPAEYVAAGTMGVAALVLSLLPPDDHNVSGSWLFDAGVRQGLRLGSPGARATADTLSDIGLWSLVSYPFVDAALAATLLQADRRVPVELAVQAALVLSAAALTAYATKNLIARERPFGPSCRADRGYAPECADRHPASFISGHATLSFAAATIACVQHDQLALYGDPIADTAACAVPLALATATSVLRVVSDQHHATDVLAGAIAGALSGLGLGLLLHY